MADRTALSGRGAVRPGRRTAALGSALLVCVALGAGAWLIQREPTVQARPAGSPSSTPDPPSVMELPAPEEDVTPTATPATTAIPPGTGQFATAPGVGARTGAAGRYVRYEVKIEVGSAVDPGIFAAAVEETLAEPRGWTAAGRWSFQRFGEGPTDLTIHLAAPDTTAVLCGRYGVRTNGEVSCRGGRNVVINLRRWRFGVPWYEPALREYQHMVVNHEVGHFLGFGHAVCPAAGTLAPVMQRQTLGLGGCTRNPWPYPDGRTFLTGPDAPY